MVHACLESMCALENCQWCGVPCFAGPAMRKESSVPSGYEAVTVEKREPLLCREWNPRLRSHGP
jgi:hypothetical protein